MKRIAIIPLVVLLIFIAPLSVFATDLPENVVDGINIYGSFWYKNFYSDETKSIYDRLIGVTGEAYNYVFRFTENDVDSQGSMVQMLLTFTLDDDYDVYVMHPSTYEVTSDNFIDLYAYYSPSESFTYTFTANSFTWNIDFATNELTYSPHHWGEFSTECTFSKFNNVPMTKAGYTMLFPADTQQMSVSSYAFPYGVFITRLGDFTGGGGEDPGGGGEDPGGDGEDTSGSDPGGDDTGGGTDGTYFDPWYDPDATLAQNISSINATYREALASATTDDERLFYSFYADNQLKYIENLSDEQSLSGGRLLSNNLASCVEDFKNGDVDLVTAMSYMSDQYSSALLQDAHTPEQGNYITTVYQVQQQQLYYAAVQQSNKRLDEAIGDAEMKDIEDHHAAEREIFNKFSMQELEDTVSYQEWFNLLTDRGSEVAAYKSFFDFFLNTAIWRYWIIVPMSFLIVSIILGTGMSVGGSYLRRAIRSYNRSRNDGDD